MTLAVLNGQYKFPAEGDPYSDGLRQLIKSMLTVRSKDRADIQTVCKRLNEKLSQQTKLLF